MKKFKWAKSKDGTYVIFAVPFFRTFSDPADPASPESGRGEVTDVMLDKLIGDVRETEAKSHYLRVFDGHHEGYQNRPGIGFMTNVRRCPIDSEVLLTDIYRISPENFDLLKHHKWPYRSAEYDKKLQKITGLALLESNEPFFLLPDLELEEQETQLTDNQKFQISRRSENIVKFQRKIEMKTISKFCDCEGGKKMPLPGKDPNMDSSAEMPSVGDNDIASTGDKAKMKCQMGDDFNTKIDSLTQMVQTIADEMSKMTQVLQTLVERDEDVHEKVEPDGEAGEESEAQEEMTEGNEKNKNSSVAYQKYKNLSDRVAMLESGKNMAKFQGDIAEIAEKTGQSICAVNETLSNFSSDKDREHYINMTKASLVKFSKHPMSSQLERVSSKFIAAENKILEKFQKEDQEDYQIAKSALRNYMDSITQADRRSAEKFQRMWPNPEKFVVHCVEFEKETPGYIAKLTM